MTPHAAPRLRPLTLPAVILLASLIACSGGGGGGGGSPVTPVVPAAFLIAADNGMTGTELFRTNGTAAGTALVKDINTNTAGSNPQNLAVIAGVTYFTVTNGSELWKSDGTESGTLLVKNINPTSTSSGNLGELTVVGSALYFRADDGVSGTELWKSSF